MQETATVNVHVNVPLEVPYLHYVEKIQRRIDETFDAEFASISENIRRHVVHLVSPVETERVINERVAMKIGRIVDSVIDEAAIERAVRSALRKATAEAVAKLLGHKT